MVYVIILLLFNMRSGAAERCNIYIKYAYALSFACSPLFPLTRHYWKKMKARTVSMFLTYLSGICPITVHSSIFVSHGQ